MLKKDNYENGHWVDNQMELMDKCNDLADVIRKKEEEIKQLKTDAIKKDQSTQVRIVKSKA